jgi:predicted amidohydrolase
MQQPKTVDLFAIQAHMELADYLTAAAFKAKIFSYGAALQERRQADHPAIVVFPEDIGMFLAALGSGNALAGCKTADDAFNVLGRKHLLRIAWALARYRITDVKAAFWLARANEVRDVMINTFSSFALEHNAYVVAGSASLPRNKHGLHLRPFAPAEGKAYNLSYTFGPSGKLLAETAKVNLVPDMEQGVGLSPGRLDDVPLLDIAGTRFATAICYDGFRCAHTQNEPGFQPLIPYFDKHGIEIVAQPSANPWPWEEKWVFAREGDTRLRKAQWLEEGAMSLMPQLSKVQYVINPQLIARFLDLNFDGRSYILARDSQGPRILAGAATIDQGEVVYAPVVPASPQGQAVGTAT